MLLATALWAGNLNAAIDVRLTKLCHCRRSGDNEWRLEEEKGETGLGRWYSFACFPGGENEPQTTWCGIRLLCFWVIPGWKKKKSVPWGASRKLDNTHRSPLCRPPTQEALSATCVVAVVLEIDPKRKGWGVDDLMHYALLLIDSWVWGGLFVSHFGKNVRRHGWKPVCAAGFHLARNSQV